VLLSPAGINCQGRAQDAARCTWLANVIQLTICWLQINAGIVKGLTEAVGKHAPGVSGIAFPNICAALVAQVQSLPGVVAAFEI
jgi:hypothetical protein